MYKYLITSKEFYSDKPASFSKILHQKFKMHMPEYALYRDKTNPDYKILALNFVELCNQFDGMKSFLHQDVELAVQLGATGIHLTSTQAAEIVDAKNKGLEVVISTHTHEEVLKAEMLGADAVTYSPVFASPNKGEPKGLDDLKILLNKCDIKVFALGGIVTSEHVKKIEETGVFGFASIRYFC